MESTVRIGVARLLHWSDQLVNRAVAGYDSLVGLEPGDVAKIHYDLGSDLARRGRGKEALEALAKTLALEPENAEAWFLVGTVHLQKGASAAALQAFSRARELGCDTAALHARTGEALAELDRHEEAVAPLQTATARDPKAPEGFYRLGVTLDKLARYDEALASFERAIELDPRVVAYQQSLGFALESLGKHEQAVACFKRAVELEHRAGT